MDLNRLLYDGRPVPMVHEPGKWWPITDMCCHYLEKESEF